MAFFKVQAKTHEEQIKQLFRRKRADVNLEEYRVRVLSSKYNKYKITDNLKLLSVRWSKNQSETRTINMNFGNL